MTPCCTTLNVGFPFSHLCDGIVIVMLVLHSYHFFSLNVCVCLEKFPHEYERNPRHSPFVGTPSAQLLVCIAQAALPLPVYLCMYRLWWHRSKPFLGYFSENGICILGLNGFILFFLAICTLWVFLLFIDFFFGGGVKQWKYWRCNFKKKGSKLESYRLFACIH